jgi:hypothetical protein
MNASGSRLLSVGLIVLGAPAVLSSQSVAGVGPVDAREVRGAILQMQRLDRDRGLALTDSTLLFTHDGGASWADVGPDRGLDGVSGVFFLGADRGWLAGVTPGSASRLVVLDTADGGGSWRERSIEASDLAGGRVYAGAGVHFADAAHGWLLGRVATGAAMSVGELLATADGGETWERLPSPPAAGRLVFASAERGFMTGAPVSERLYRTLDGGRSWHELGLRVSAAPGRAQYGLPAFSTPQDGTLAVTVGGDRPSLLTFVTGDGGLTWQRARSLALPAGDYGEPVAVALRANGSAAALALGTSVVLDTAGGRRALSMTSRSARATPDGAVPSVQALSIGDDGQGWALVAEGRCGEGGCRQTTRLVAFDGSSGSRGVAADLLSRAWSYGPSRVRPGASSTAGLTISQDKGFDKCAAASTAQMQTWRTSSPYRDANIYHGGIARGCSQPNLSASWVKTVFQQGWRLIPTWVGPQAPCSGFGSRFSADAATARGQGLAEADAAVNAAAALGLGPSTPVYYDMEYYSTTTACSAAVRAFVDGWTERVQTRGYVAGVYGTASNTQTDWRPGLFTHVPDAVWVAAWACTGATCSFTPSVFGIPGLSDAYWTNNQRIRQYWGGHNETWGGATFNIDSNHANGPVASPDATSLADLVVDSVSVSPAIPVAGQAVTFTAVVRNAGTAPTPSGVPIGVAYRIDGTPVTRGVVSGPLASGASVSVGATASSLSVTPGSHVVAAVADDLGAIPEANEANNQLSRSITVSPPPSCLASVPTADWKGEYFAGTQLTGSARMVRDEGTGSLGLDWGTGGPGCGLPADGFSARFTRTASFAAGRQRFTARSDDGVRVWVDGTLLLDKWLDQAPTTYTFEVSLTAGSHTVRAEYYENTGGALLQLSWQPVQGVAQFICDDGDHCLALAGSSAYWHRATACGGSALGYGGDMYWTYVNGSTVSNSARWTPILGGSGTYQVSVFVPRCNATSQQATYRIVHDGVTDVRSVNQNAYYDAWVSLGSFAFAGSGGEYVELTDATGESYTTRRLLAVDAVRWVRQ